MNWLNLELTQLRSEVYLGSEPIHRATWLNLMAYCADQENGGLITDCNEWGDRRWLQLIGVTKDEVFTESKLWKVGDDGIRLWGYPRSQEIAVQAKRKAGKGGGRPKKVNSTSADKPHGSENDNHKDMLSNNVIVKEGKGKEGNSKENIKSGFTVSDLDSEPRNLLKAYDAKDLDVIRLWLIDKCDCLDNMSFPLMSAMELDRTFTDAPFWCAAPILVKKLAGAEIKYKRQTVGYVRTVWAAIDLNARRKS